MIFLGVSLFQFISFGFRKCKRFVEMYRIKSDETNALNESFTIFELMKVLKVVELFAGVGGFRLGLQAVSERAFRVVLSNQWEPSTKRQHANKFMRLFPSSKHNGESIENILVDEIPEHDFLVGGFPCQDYSVATGLKNSAGLYGKKGVLWWQIERILREKGESAPNYLILENVDRLLKSPADQRGRDFAVMLTSLNKLGYAVEWRVVNAADYGFVQKRRRVFILAYRNGTKLYQELIETGLERWMRADGLFQETFPAEFLSTGFEEPHSIEQPDIDKVSEEFNKGARRTLPSPLRMLEYMSMDTTSLRV